MTAAGLVAGRRYDFRASYRWGKVRSEVLSRDRRRCRVGLPGCRSIATEVDHITPVQSGGDRYALGNLRAACSSCNKRRNGRGAAIGKPPVFRYGHNTPDISLRSLSPSSPRLTLGGDYSRKPVDDGAA